MKKRILSMLLCMALCLSLLPTAVFAEELSSTFAEEVYDKETLAHPENLRFEGMVCKWDRVPNATYYRVTLYDAGGSLLLMKRVLFDTQCTFHLEEGESYKFKVVAGTETDEYYNSERTSDVYTYMGPYDGAQLTLELTSDPVIGTTVTIGDEIIQQLSVKNTGTVPVKLEGVYYEDLRTVGYNDYLLNPDDVDPAARISVTVTKESVSQNGKAVMNSYWVVGYTEDGRKVVSNTVSSWHTFREPLIPWRGVGLLPTGIMRWRPIEGASSYYVTVDSLGFTVTKTSYNVKSLCEEKDMAPGPHTVTLVARDENGKTISETWTGTYNFAHSVETVPGKAATCTESGLTEGQKCSACGRIFVPQETIPAKGHNYQNGKCTVCGAADPNAKTVNHRLYNPYTLEHMFCSDETERQRLLSIGWTYDGIAFMTPASGKPVYRLYNPAGDWHTYSADSNEIANLENQGWSVDGVMCFSADSNGRPVYRMYNPYEPVNYLLFTSGTEERDWLVTLGWVYQGITWYVEK